MGIEAFNKRNESATSLEGKASIIRTTDTVIGELTKDGSVERLSREAQRVLLRILRRNIKGAKVMLVGEARTMVDPRVHSIEVRYASVG
jgi:hypothetical protein